MIPRTVPVGSSATARIATLSVGVPHRPRPPGRPGPRPADGPTRPSTWPPIRWPGGSAAYALIADASLAWAADDGGPEASSGRAVDEAVANGWMTLGAGRPCAGRLDGPSPGPPPALRPPAPRARTGPRPLPVRAGSPDRGPRPRPEPWSSADESRHRRRPAPWSCPWSHPALLRAHLPPIARWTRLAAATAAAGRQDAAQLLDRLPDRRTLLERVVDRSPAAPGPAATGDTTDGSGPGPAGNDGTDRTDGADGGSAPSAVDLGQATGRPNAWSCSTPAATPADPRSRTLGPAGDRATTHRRPGHDTWRRARVRELLAFLIEHRSARPARRWRQRLVARSRRDARPVPTSGSTSTTCSTPSTRTGRTSGPARRERRQPPDPQRPGHDRHRPLRRADGQGPDPRPGR